MKLVRGSVLLDVRVPHPHELQDRRLHLGGEAGPAVGEAHPRDGGEEVDREERVVHRRAGVDPGGGRGRGGVHGGRRVPALADRDGEAEENAQAQAGSEIERRGGADQGIDHGVARPRRRAGRVVDVRQPQQRGEAGQHPVGKEQGRGDGAGRFALELVKGDGRVGADGVGRRHRPQLPGQRVGRGRRRWRGGGRGAAAGRDRSILGLRPGSRERQNQECNDDDTDPRPGDSTPAVDFNEASFMVPASLGQSRFRRWSGEEKPGNSARPCSGACARPPHAYSSAPARLRRRYPGADGPKHDRATRPPA